MLFLDSHIHRVAHRVLSPLFFLQTTRAPIATRISFPPTSAGIRLVTPRGTRIERLERPQVHDPGPNWGRVPAGSLIPENAK